MSWAVLEEACLSIRCQRFRLHAEAISLLIPTFETGFGGSSPRGSQNFHCLQRLRPVGVIKMSSSVEASRRLRELIHSVFCADRRVDGQVRCTRPERCRSRFGLSRLTWGLPLGPQLGCSVPKPVP